MGAAAKRVSARSHYAAAAGGSASPLRGAATGGTAGAGRTRSAPVRHPPPVATLSALWLCRALRLLLLCGLIKAHPTLLCRYVRQDDGLWDQLHEGVLTTGGLQQACWALPVGRRQYTQPLSQPCNNIRNLHACGQGLSIAPVHAGLVRGALGLYEASAVKKLGIPSSRQGGRVTSEYPAVNTPH